MAVPDPKIYRALLRDLAIKLRGKPASTEQQEEVLGQILGDISAERVVFSWDGFMALPPYVLRETLYPAAGERVPKPPPVAPALVAAAATAAAAVAPKAGLVPD